MTTANKKNHCKIRFDLQQTIFKKFLDEQELQANHVGQALAGINRTVLSMIAQAATNAVMHDSSVEVVLKRN